MNKEITAPVTYLNETFSLKKDLEKKFIQLAEHLYHIFTQKLFEKNGYGSFDEFLIELGLSAPMASKLISVYRTYVVEGKVSLTQLAKARSWESLYYVRSLAKDEKSANELAEKAEVMSQHDMRLLTNGEEECSRHEWYTYRACAKCGAREKVYDTP